jgi:hypothetical protein
MPPIDILYEKALVHTIETIVSMTVPYAERLRPSP